MKNNSNPFDNEKLKQATSPFLIDGYDTTILEDRAYLKLDNNMLKLEYRLNTLENNLQIIKDEIKTAKNIDDFSRLSLLENKKDVIEKEIKILNEKYYNIGIMSKITSIISNMFRLNKNGKEPFLSKIKNKILNYILPIISKRMNFIFEMQQSLRKLTDINKSVDELISLRIPFGGMTGRYEKLTSYVNKANFIHAKITHNVESFENKKKRKTALPNNKGNILNIVQ